MSKRVQQIITSRDPIHNQLDQDYRHNSLHDTTDEIIDEDDEDLGDLEDSTHLSAATQPHSRQSPNIKSSQKSVARIESNLYSGLRQKLKEVDKSGSTHSTHPFPKLTQEVKELPKNYDKTPKTGSNCSWLITVSMAIFALFISFHLFDGQRFFAKNQIKNMTEWQTFRTEFESFERIYSEVIPIKGFKILSTSVKTVMNRNKWSQTLPNTSPAIVLLIASEDKVHILKCVKRDFVNSINKAYNEDNPIVINGRQTDATDIVDKFDLNFRDHRKHTIVIENIESIAPNDVMSLHQFTDHQNAKYKDVFIVLTAIHYQDFNLTNSANPREMDSIASQLLEVKWKNHLPSEQSFALISRLTPSVVTVIGESHKPFKC